MGVRTAYAHIFGGAPFHFPCEFQYTLNRQNILCQQTYTCVPPATYTLDCIIIKISIDLDLISQIGQFALEKLNVQLCMTKDLAYVQCFVSIKAKHSDIRHIVTNQHPMHAQSAGHCG